jgi:hypothetical protein
VFEQLAAFNDYLLTFCVFDELFDDFKHIGMLANFIVNQAFWEAELQIRQHFSFDLCVLLLNFKVYRPIIPNEWLVLLE